MKHAPERLPSLLLQFTCNTQTYYYGLSSGVTGIQSPTSLHQGQSNSSENFQFGTIDLFTTGHKIAQEGKGALQAYADDSITRAEFEKHFQTLQTLIQGGAEIGLSPNTEKFRIRLCLTNNEALDNFKRTQYQSLCIPSENILHHPASNYLTKIQQQAIEQQYGNTTNGIPYGHPTYVKQELESIVKNLNRELNDILQLNDFQYTYHLIRTVLDSKILHLLRQLLPTDALWLAHQ